MDGKDRGHELAAVHAGISLAVSHLAIIAAMLSILDALHAHGWLKQAEPTQETALVKKLIARFYGPLVVCPQILSEAFARTEPVIEQPTLRYPYEVRKAEDYFCDLPDLTLALDMLTLAEHILDSKAADFDPLTFCDRYCKGREALFNSAVGREPLRSQGPTPHSR